VQTVFPDVEVELDEEFPVLFFLVTGTQDKLL